MTNAANPLLGSGGPNLHHWKVQMQSDDGNLFEVDAHVRWNPEHEGAMEAVMNAVGAEQSVAYAKRQKRCVAVSAVLQAA